MAILIQYINKETFKTEITRKSGILYNEKGQSIRQKKKILSLNVYAPKTWIQRPWKHKRKP